MTTSHRTLIFAALCLLLAVMACNCDGNYVAQVTSINAIENNMGDPEVATCVTGLTVMGVNSVDPAEAHAACQQNPEAHLCFNNITEGMTAEEILAACYPAAPQPQNNGTTSVQSKPKKADCSAFRLTSPLDGLPNGVAAFYWDPIPGAQSYVVNVYGDGAYLASFGAPAGSNMTSGDVSQGAIGGNFSFYIEAVAVLADGTTCVSGASVGRASGGSSGDGSGGDGDSDDDGGDSGDNGGGSDDSCATNPQPSCIK